VKTEFEVSDEYTQNKKKKKKKKSTSEKCTKQREANISIVTRITIARQPVGKHIPATQAQATIGHPLLGNGPVNTHSWQ
jgi:hypothetical protein